MVSFASGHHISLLLDFDQYGGRSRNFAAVQRGGRAMHSGLFYEDGR